MRTILLIALCCLVIVGSSCAPASAPSESTKAILPTDSENLTPVRSDATASITSTKENQVTSTPESVHTATLAQAEEFDRSLLKYRGMYFSSSGECSICHQQMVDKNGQDVSIDSQWRASMMANASRDPYYLAKVSEEAQRYEGFREVIETKCGICHLPMGMTTAEFEEQSTLMLGDGLLSPDQEYFPLSLDGVSCTACHQIQNNNLGELSSFSGNFTFDSENTVGERVVFSPYTVDEDMALIMNSASGYKPQEGLHVNESTFCAVCHTLFTNTITVDGKLTEHMFPEQTPFLEWQMSQYSPQVSCQNCHMPVAPGEINTSIIAGQPRSPFYKHIFVGGNSYILMLIRNNAAALHVTAEDSQFEQKIEAVTEQLQERTAKLNVSVQQVDNHVNVVVKVTNLTGHKFPTGYPSRRSWLHITVIDQQEEIVFESGNWRKDGLIFGNINDEDPTEFEPHYQNIVDRSQVQIYETIFIDTDEKISTTLMNAFMYVKYNRLLPAGFEKMDAPDEIRPVGAAMDDENFSSSEDIVIYSIPYDGDSATLQIEIELLYQSIGYKNS